MVLPEEYVDSSKGMEKRRKYFFLGSTLAVFLFSFYFLGALIHEISHILVLEAANCDYTSSWNFSFLSGLTASIQPLCGLNNIGLFIFYGSGYFSHLIFGLILTGLILKTERFSGYITGSAAIGVLLSLISTMTVHGDIVNAMKILGYSDIGPIIIYLFTVTLSTVLIVGIVRELKRKELS